MTVTKDQAQMLATLAAACRPNGASRWDTAGTMAAIKRLEGRDLAEVIMATIRAARDRDVDNPGILPTAGPHWAERLAPAAFVPQTMDSTRRCSACSMAEPACLVLHGGHCDGCAEGTCGHHEFRSAAQAAKEAAASDPAALTTAIHALKASIETHEEPPVKTLDELKAERPGFAARLEKYAERLPEMAMQETEPEESA